MIFFLVDVLLAEDDGPLLVFVLGVVVCSCVSTPMSTSASMFLPLAATSRQDRVLRRSISVISSVKEANLVIGQ